MKEALHSLFFDFFSKLGIEIDSFAFETEEEEKNIYRAHVQTSDSKLLIGIHGKTLESLSHILSRMAEKKLGKHAIVRVEVNDYLKTKENRLFQYVDSKIHESGETGKVVILNHLTAYERKLVHDYVQKK